jgi:hypothetical protein
MPGFNNDLSLFVKELPACFQEFLGGIDGQLVIGLVDSCGLQKPFKKKHKRLGMGFRCGV